MTLLGLDCSHFQSGINLRNVAAENLSFVIGKISQGSTSHDAQWAATRDQGRAAGLILIGYHYVTTDPPAAQAANCAAWIGDKTIPVALDWEANGGNWSNLLAVLAAFRSAGLNVRLLYTGAWYHQQVGSPDMTGCGLALWKSRYPSTNPGAPTTLYANVPASYWAPLGGLNTALLQFTDRASIAGMATDCSAFQGTRDDLVALLGGTNPPVPGGDALTPAQAAQLTDIWNQLLDINLPWPGGISDKEINQNPAPYTLLQTLMRNNVEIHQTFLLVQKLQAELTALKQQIGS
jgi:hypothetical protein